MTFKPGDIVTLTDDAVEAWTFWHMPLPEYGIITTEPGKTIGNHTFVDCIGVGVQWYRAAGQRMFEDVDSVCVDFLKLSPLTLAVGASSCNSK